jgi:hypothetical protein
MHRSFERLGLCPFYGYVVNAALNRSTGTASRWEGMFRRDSSDSDEDRASDNSDTFDEMGGQRLPGTTEDAKVDEPTHFFEVHEGSLCAEALKGVLC